MAGPPLSAAFPSRPLFDQITGQILPAWRGFFLALYTRTGEAQGTSTAGLTTALGAEAAVRHNADATLTSGLASETTSRIAADNTEHAGRVAADAALRAAMLPLSGGTLTGVLTGPVGTFTTVRTGGPAGPTWTGGTVPPTSVQPIGSLYSCTTGAVGARVYVSAGAGTWTPIPGV